MARFFIFLFLVSVALADFNSHIFEEENKALGLDKNGLSPDDIDEFNLEEDEDNDEGSGVIDCGEEEKNCHKRHPWLGWIKCLNVKKHCCYKKLRICQVSTHDMSSYDGCYAPFTTCMGFP